jgi:hypothetical protein
MYDGSGKEKNLRFERTGCRILSNNQVLKAANFYKDSTSLRLYGNSG